MKNIVKKYLENKATSQELIDLLHWARNNKNSADFKKYKSEWEGSLDKSWFPEEGADSWNEIQTVMLGKNFAKWKKTKTINLISRIAAIFFFAFTLGGTIWFFSANNKQEKVYYTNVVAENGQISKIELPDGSLVWLNSGSQLRYNNCFAANNRDIQLSGEAFFEVKRNEEIPLVVSCDYVKVKVLGTKFDVASYPDSKTVNVVLEKGSVELLNNNFESFYRMKPGEFARFEKENRKLNVSEVNTIKFTSWKDGIINIYNQSLSEVVKRLETRYNQRFSFDENIKDFHYTFTIKNESLSDIIKLMEKITPVKVTQKGDVIFFQKDETKINKADR